MYGDISMINLTCVLSYTLPMEIDIQTCKLFPQQDLYKNKIQYYWTITDSFTKNSGNMMIRLTFFDTNNKIVRTSLPTILPIYSKALINSPNVPADILTSIQESLSTKATGITISDDYITLLANKCPIGVPLKISDIVTGLDDNLKDYSNMINKPYINGVKLEGTKTLEDIGLKEITNTDIEEMIKNLGGL